MIGGWLFAPAVFAVSIASANVAGARVAGVRVMANTAPADADLVLDGDSVSDLPLVEVPAPTGSLLAVLLSGDGGWSSADKSLAAALAKRGVAVVGFDSPKYLAHARTPDQAADALSRILRHYLAAWHRARVAIVGYSRGADLAPFMISRLPSELRERVALAALLGPSAWAGFKFHVVDLVRNVHRTGDLPVQAEVAKLHGTPVLCIYGEKDRDAICPALAQAGLARTVVREGGHRIHGDEGSELADTILTALPAHE